MKQLVVNKDNFIVKKNTQLDLKEGYVFVPKKECKYDGISLKSIKILKKSLITQIIKRKIKYHLDQFLKIIIDNIDDCDCEGSEKSLIDLKKYYRFVNRKYSIYLDEKYMQLLKKRVGIIERELQNNIQNSIDEEVIKRSR